MPEDKPEIATPARRGARHARRDPIPIRSSRRTLLLVDDDPLCARFIGHAARECGFSAVVTISAESFKAQYRDAEAEVVVVDLAMPCADGIELLRFLAGEGCKARIVIISGFDGRVVEAAMRLGSALGLNMGGALNKPIRFEQLAKAIRQDGEGPNAVSICL